MGEAHPRGAMEDGWIPGEVQWPAPVDCLLSGMNTSDAHMMFGGGGNHMLPQQFRAHRFHQIANSTSHLVEIPGQININLSIPPHSMVEGNGQVQVDQVDNGSALVSDAGQSGHSLPLDDRNMLEDTDDATDEDDEDEVEDDELSVNMPHETHDGVPLSHIMNDESMVQCQQVPVQVQGGLHQQQPTMMNMSEAHCHPKQLSNNGLLRQVMNGHEQQQHNLQQHPHPHAHVSSMMPIFTEQVDFGVNESQQPQQVQQQNENSDPNSGFSVHGKMYLEGRIVLHLKQWNDPHSNNDGLSFPSCAEDHHKNHMLGCAVCRLNTPMTHGQENHRVQKEAHRHTVKGVFFTFEDCTIVELYPEQFNCTISSTEIKQNGHPKQHLNHQNQQIPISYLNSTIPQQPQQPQHNNPPKRHIIQPLDIENLSVGPQTMITAQQQQQSLQSDKPQPHDNEDDSWLDEFESAPEGEDELKENESTEDDSNPVPDELNSSSCANLNNHHQNNQEDTNDDEDDDDREDEDIEDDDYNEKPLKYHSSEHAEYGDSGKLSTSSTAQIESHSFQNQNNGAMNDELDMSSSEGNMAATDPITPEPNPSGSLADVLRVESEESCHSTTIRSLIKMRNDLKSDMKRVAEQPPPNGKYRCPMPSCAKSFHFKKLLKRHLEEDHASGNPFLCTECGLQCTDDKRFKQHICSIRRRLLLKRLGTNSAKSSKVAKNDRSRKNPAKKEEQSGDGEKSEEETDSGEKVRSIRHDSSKLSGNLKPTTAERDKNESQEDDGSSSGQEDENDDGLGDNSNDDESMEATSNSKSQSPDHKRKDRGGKSFKCDVCGKSFSMERRLENHKLSHGVEKTSQCEKCGKRFARKDKLMRHMFVHNEEKMFSCDTCGKKFSRRDKLTDHLKSHGGADEIHNCPMCQKQFLRPDILKQHVKLHGMGNKHQCPECLRFVTGQDRLQKHMARHVEAKALGQTLLCPLCTKYFIQRQSLRAHIKKFHPYSDIDVDGSQGPSGQGQSNSDEGLDLEDQLSLGTGSSSGKISQSEESKPLECSECGKHFSKKAAFKKHIRKHGHTQLCEDAGKQESPSPTVATSAASAIPPLEQHVDTEDSDGLEESQKDINISRARTPSEDDLAIMENPSPVQIHSTAPPSCLLMSMSFASQLGSSCSVSSSSSSSPPMTAIVESGPPRTILSTQRPLSTTISHFSLNPHQHPHLHQHIPGNSNGLAAHIPLSLAAAAAAVSAPPSMTSSSQQNGLLSLGASQTTHLTTHALHSHHHHLLQHSHSHGHSTSPQGLIHPPIVHPQGHLHPHLGQHMPISSMQHHVNVSMATQQTMCGSPYVLYPHYPYQ